VVGAPLATGRETGGNRPKTFPSTSSTTTRTEAGSRCQMTWDIKHRSSTKHQKNQKESWRADVPEKKEQTPSSDPFRRKEQGESALLKQAGSTTRGGATECERKEGRRQVHEEGVRGPMFTRGGSLEAVSASRVLESSPTEMKEGFYQKPWTCFESYHTRNSAPAKTTYKGLRGRGGRRVATAILRVKTTEESRASAKSTQTGENQTTSLQQKMK